MPHAAMSPDNVAVITGGASGIGLAAAMRFVRLGMRRMHRRCWGKTGLRWAAAALTKAAPAGRSQRHDGSDRTSAAPMI